MAQKSFLLLVVLVLGAVFVASFYSSNTGFATRSTNIPAFTTTKLFLSSPTQVDSYSLQFTNRQGVVYTFPYLTHRQNRFSYGDGQRDLVFSEASSPTAYNIGLNDSFVLSDQTTPLDDTAVSRVVQYINFDLPNQVLDFYEKGSGMKSFTFQCTTAPTICIPGRARLNFAGNTYDTYVNSAGDLAIDMNADNSINGRKINLVAEESGKRFIIDLGYQQFSGNGLSILPGSTPLTFFHSSSTIINRLTLVQATIGGFPVIQLQEATTPN